MLIDPFKSTWLASLDSFAASGASVHLLLDGAFVPGLYRELRQHSISGEGPILLFEAFPGCNEEARDASPFLIRYSGNNTKLRKKLAKCDGLPMVHALFSDEPTRDLGSRLAGWCAVTADHQRFNLRFPDTRRVAGIFSALDTDQQTALIGPIGYWKYIARDGNWTELDLSMIKRGVEPERVLFEDGCLVLDARQFAAMVDDGDADSILLLLSDRGLSWSMRRSESFSRVQQALALAKTEALDEAMKLDWCEACLTDASLLNDPTSPQGIKQWKQTAEAEAETP